MPTGFIFRKGGPSVPKVIGMSLYSIFFVVYPKNHTFTHNFNINLIFNLPIGRQVLNLKNER
jgi:hypothetical protein